MALGRRLHHHSAPDDAGGTIDHPRFYEILSTTLFGGRRRRAFERLTELAAVSKGDEILDVGCGTGYWVAFLATATGPTGRVVGVDASGPMIEHARRANGAANCSYLVGEGQDLDLPDASFDIVTSSLALHHIPVDGRPAALREMCRVLRPGGRLLIAEFRPPANRVAKHLVGALTGPAMQHNPIDRLPGLITDAGLKVESVGDLRPFLRYVRAIRPVGTS